MGSWREAVRPRQEVERSGSWFCCSGGSWLGCSWGQRVRDDAVGHTEGLDLAAAAGFALAGGCPAGTARGEGGQHVLGECRHGLRHLGELGAVMAASARRSRIWNRASSDQISARTVSAWPERSTGRAPFRSILTALYSTSIFQRRAYRAASSSAGAVSGSVRLVTRQNTSEVVLPLPSARVVMLYSITRTVIGGPSRLRRGFSSAR